MANGTILTIRQAAADTTEAVYGESASGAKNNSNMSFTTSNDYVASTLCVYYNGQRLLLDIDYIESGSNAFDLLYIKPYSVDELLIDYVLQST